MTAGIALMAFVAGIVFTLVFAVAVSAIAARKVRKPGTPPHPSWESYSKRLRDDEQDKPQW